MLVVAQPNAKNVWRGYELTPKALNGVEASVRLGGIRLSEQEPLSGGRAICNAEVR